MAARLRKTHQDEVRPFYVYELVKDGEVQYVGKGSGRRLRNQERTFGLEGREIARFAKESQAYEYEVQRIAEVKPPLNKHKGGNGSRATIKACRVPAWVKEIERLGSKRYAAMLIMRFGPHLVDPSKVDAIRRIAHG